MNLRSFSLKTAAAGLVLAVGVPAIALAANPFEDVPDGQWYSEPVDWAYNEGITTGKTPTSFNGWDTTNRYEVVTFVHRFFENIVEPDMAQTDAQIGNLQDDVEEAVEIQYGLFGHDEQGGSLITSDTTGESVGVSTSVTIPAGHEGVIVVELSGESACYDGVGLGDYCEVNLFVDGDEISTFGHAFDSTDGTETFQSWESHTVRAVSSTLTPGTYTITAEAEVSHGSVVFYLDDALLTAEVQLTGAHVLGLTETS